MNGTAFLEPFHVKDCTLAAIATGIKAQTLIELRDRIATIPSSSIYFHFWGGRLRTSFEHREYHNDFAFWVHHSLHDDVLAERLELLNPTEYDDDMENLRAELVEILDNRIEEKEYVPWSKLEEQFHFIRTKIVIFQTRHVLHEPADLVKIVPLLTRSSLFYHFIDSTRRVPSKTDDFSTWLQQSEDQFRDLIIAMRKLDPYLISLKDLQGKLKNIVNEYFLRAQ